MGYMGISWDLIIIYPKPYFIYLRGTTGFWVLGLLGGSSQAGSQAALGFKDEGLG